MFPPFVRLVPQREVPGAQYDVNGLPSDNVGHSACASRDTSVVAPRHHSSRAAGSPQIFFARNVLEARSAVLVGSADGSSGSYPSMLSAGNVASIRKGGSSPDSGERHDQIERSAAIALTAGVVLAGPAIAEITEIKVLSAVVMKSALDDLAATSNAQPATR